MMSVRIHEHWRTIIAALFSAILVIGAYALAHGIGSPQVAQASTETALLQAIATKDSSGDGLPDWEKSLYGIPINATTTDYFNLGMTDGEAVAKGLIVPKAIANVPTASATSTGTVVDPSLPPAVDGTLTSAFAQNFFTLYLTAKQNADGADLSDTDLQNIADEALSSLSTAVAPAPDFKSASDLTVSGTGASALTAFAVSAEAVLLKNTSIATSTDLDYLKEAITNNDDTAFTHIASISKMYRGSAAGLAVLPVPEELATDDLLLINTLMRLSEIDDDFTRASTDPLAAMLALEQYPQVAESLGQAFIDIGNIYAAAGVSLPAGTPGASFVNLISNVTASQQAAKTP